MNTISNSGSANRIGEAINNPDDQLLSTPEAAAYLHISTKTMENWRWQSRGPDYVKVGRRSVRYQTSDLQQFVRRGLNPIQPESDDE
jgi:predicted DNA-binding transcriptional regulator AlpA